jgi:hypothetical protein
VAEDEENTYLDLRWMSNLGYYVGFEVLAAVVIRYRI